MDLATRKIMDRSFTAVGYIAILLMVMSVILLLTPIFFKGAGAILFRATVEHRRMMYEVFDHGNKDKLDAELAAVDAARKPVYDTIEAFKQELKTYTGSKRRDYEYALEDVEHAVRELLGPFPGEPEQVLIRNRYGQTRWDRARVKLHDILYMEEWDYSDPTKMGQKVYIPRTNLFHGTALEPMFGYCSENVKGMMHPRPTFYWQFLTDKSVDAHFFGGIMPELLGTLYLALGAMIFAVPIGILAAVYLTEYARENNIIRLIRTCMSTLAGVPSIVFGLFGLAFFINTVKVSNSKSVLAGSLTLALLVLPTIIRASEEAIRAVPRTFREAALGLGAGKWHTVVTVVLPAALPGILTGIVISLGRAAGETAPIIFTAAVSVGLPLKLWQVFSQPTPALSWNIYNLCTEHEAVDEIRHVQYGMVFVLVALVLILNLGAILFRARITKKLKG
jgi:phosphate transport system permease protein